MELDIQARERSLRILKSKIDKRKILVILFGITLILTPFVNGYLIKYPFIYYYHEFIFYIGIIIFGAGISLMDLDAQDEIFINVMDAINLIMEGQNSPIILEKATENLKKAAIKMESLSIKISSINSKYYDDTIKKEKEFIYNVSNRGVEALRSGSLSKQELISIAKVFLYDDISYLDQANKILAKFDEKPKKTLVSKIIFMINNHKYYKFLRKTNTGKFILSFVLGIISFTISTYLYSYFSHQELSVIINNPYFIISVPITFITLFFNYIKNN